MENAFLVWDATDRVKFAGNPDSGDTYRKRRVTIVGTQSEAMDKARHFYSGDEVSQFVFELQNDGSCTVVGFIGEMDGKLLADYGAAWSWASREMQRAVAAAAVELYQIAFAPEV